MNPIPLLYYMCDLNHSMINVILMFRTFSIYIKFIQLNNHYFFNFKIYLLKKYYFTLKATK